MICWHVIAVPSVGVVTRIVRRIGSVGPVRVPVVFIIPPPVRVMRRPGRCNACIGVLARSLTIVSAPSRCKLMLGL